MAKPRPVQFTKDSFLRFRTSCRALPFDRSALGSESLQPNSTSRIVDHGLRRRKLCRLVRLNFGAIAWDQVLLQVPNLAVYLPLMSIV